MAYTIEQIEDLKAQYLGEIFKYSAIAEASLYNKLLRLVKPTNEREFRDAFNQSQRKNIARDRRTRRPVIDGDRTTQPPVITSCIYGKSVIGTNLVFIDWKQPAGYDYALEYEIEGEESTTHGTYFGTGGGYISAGDFVFGDNYLEDHADKVLKITIYATYAGTHNIASPASNTVSVTLTIAP